MSTNEPTVLSYSTLPVAGKFQKWLMRPIGWKAAVLVFLWCTWPFVWTAHRPDFLALAFPVAHFFIGGTLVGLAIGAFSIRSDLRYLSAARFHAELEPDGWPNRVIVAAVVFILLHVCKVPMVVIFTLHRPWFDAARDAIVVDPKQWRTVHPGMRIGLYKIEAIHSFSLPRANGIGFMLDKQTAFVARDDDNKGAMAVAPPNRLWLNPGWEAQVED